MISKVESDKEKIIRVLGLQTSLRAIFDPLCHEYKDMAMIKKADTLNKIMKETGLRVAEIYNVFLHCWKNHPANMRQDSISALLDIIQFLFDTELEHDSKHR